MREIEENAFTKLQMQNFEFFIKNFHICLKIKIEIVSSEFIWAKWMGV